MKSYSKPHIDIIPISAAHLLLQTSNVTNMRGWTIDNHMREKTVFEVTQQPGSSNDDDFLDLD